MILAVSQTHLSSQMALTCGLLPCALGALFTGQLQSWNQLDAYNYFHCSYEQTILWESDSSMLCWIPVMFHNWQYPPPLSFTPVELCVSTLHEVFWHSRRHSNSWHLESR